ncbi:MAG: glycoside hydrolase family 28 protein [Prevotella sp.]|nr:glycoside hydrolase family 28 protein [Prevotella sp.]
MQKRLLTPLLLLICVSIAAAGTRTIDARKAGIKGDGQTLNTTAIQQAIDQLGKKGGGRLVFPAGQYLTGSLQMRSNVELHLEQDATILGSTDPNDYEELDMRLDSEDARKDNSRLALILAYKTENIALTGQGTIDGNGLQLALNIDSLHHIGERIDPNYNQRRQRPGETARPKLFLMAECKGIRVEGLHLRNSACWGLTFDLCQQITLDSLNILNRAYWNNDGIDLTDCQHVSVSHCRINAADDGVCLKSYHADACCDDISVSDCDISSSASAVKFGTASWGGFRNITVDNIRVRDTFRSAIAIESVDGGAIDSIRVSRIHAVNTGNPIFIRLGHRAGAQPGTIRNVEISDLYCEVPFGRPDIDYDLRGPEVDYFHNPMPCVISGIPGHRIESVTIRRAEIIYPGRASKGMAYVPLWRLKDIPEQINKYPEFTMFGEMPAWGFFVRHVDSIIFDDVRLRTVGPDFRPPYVFDDVGQH